MNAKQFEAIRERDEKKLIRSSVLDRSELVKEVTLLYRLNERMDAQILAVRQLTTSLEIELISDNPNPSADAVAYRLRKIVGPR